ncbi:MAG TPA: hypothetical protein VGI42_04780 [Chthoniobacterales bacterium]|jgi:hypothetical protein
MITPFPGKANRIALNLLAAFVFISAGIDLAFAGNAVAPDCDLPAADQEIKIQYLDRDGRLVAIPNAGEKNSKSAASVTSAGRLIYPLQEGETIFLIAFASAAQLNGFTFVNENAAAQGELKIAVANKPLAARSPDWTDVNGSIAFAHKRLINLSMVGVEARYLRLSFQVEKSVVILSRRLLDAHERIAGADVNR